MRSIALLLHESTTLMKREFERVARPHELTLMQWRILGELSRNGPQRQVALGAAINASPMTVSNVADRLDAAGLIRREPDPADSRAKRVALTECGARKVEEMTEIAAGVFEKALAGIPPDEIEILRRSLERLIGNLEGC